MGLGAGISQWGFKKLRSCSRAALVRICETFVDWEIEDAGVVGDSKSKYMGITR